MFNLFYVFQLRAVTPFPLRNNSEHQNHTQKSRCFLLLTFLSMLHFVPFPVSSHNKLKTWSELVYSMKLGHSSCVDEIYKHTITLNQKESDQRFCWSGSWAYESMGACSCLLHLFFPGDLCRPSVSGYDGTNMSEMCIVFGIQKSNY